MGFTDIWDTALVAFEPAPEESGVVMLATDVITWKVDGYTIDLQRGDDGKWRPIDAYDTMMLVWQDESAHYRAAIGNGPLTRLSRRHGSPQSALRECAMWFKQLFAA